MWSISQKWLGKPGCPKTSEEMANPKVAARCAAAVLKSVGTDAWGEAIAKCKTLPPRWCAFSFFFLLCS